MTIQSTKAAPRTTTLNWDVGTAYELFVSLHVLHEPERFDIRASWAAKIRSRIPAAERTFLEEVLPFLSFPLGWLYQLPRPKNAITVLYALQQLSPAQRGPALRTQNQDTLPEEERLQRIAERGRWSKDDLKFLAPLMCHDPADQTEAGL